MTLLPRNPVNGWSVDRIGRLAFNARAGVPAGMPWCDDLILTRAGGVPQHAVISVEAHAALLSALIELEAIRVHDAEVTAALRAAEADNERLLAKLAAVRDLVALAEEPAP